MTWVAHPPGARNPHRGDGALPTAYLWVLGFAAFSVAALCFVFFLGTKVVEVRAGVALAEPAWQLVSANTVMGACRDALLAAQGSFDVPSTVWAWALVAAALLAPITVFAIAEKLPHAGSAALPLLVVGVLAVFLCGVAIGALVHAAIFPVLERLGGRS